MLEQESLVTAALQLLLPIKFQIKLQRSCTAFPITIVLHTSTTSSPSAPTILSDVNSSHQQPDPPLSVEQEPSLADILSQSVVQVSGTVCLLHYNLLIHTIHSREHSRHIF